MDDNNQQNNQNQEESAGNRDKNADDIDKQEGIDQMGQDRNELLAIEPNAKSRKMEGDGSEDQKEDDYEAHAEEGSGKIATNSENKEPVEPNAKSRKMDGNGGEEALKKDQKEDGGKDAEKGGGEIATNGENNKEPAWMSIWVWVTVLKFISRMAMAERVSLVCHGLKKLCWPRLHGDKVRPHMVGILTYRSNSVFHATDSPPPDYTLIPIATDSPPPDYIQGFEAILIFRVDSELLAFIRNVCPLLTNSDIDVGRAVPIQDLRSFLAALNECSISRLHINPLSISIPEWRANFPGLLEKIPAIRVMLTTEKECVEVDQLLLAKIGNGTSFIATVNYIWPSFEPIVPNQHFVPIADIQKAFQTAEQPQFFFIALRYYVPGPVVGVEAFRMENDKTGEVLALERIHDLKYELYRCPKGEVHQRREEAEKLAKFKAWIAFPVC